MAKPVEVYHVENPNEARENAAVTASAARLKQDGTHGRTVVHVHAPGVPCEDPNDMQATPRRFCYQVELVELDDDKSTMRTFITQAQAEAEA